jgi:hypothetical protein
MSDNLAKRLRALHPYFHLGKGVEVIEAADRIEALEAQLSQANAALEAADNLLRAVDFLADNDPYDVVCDGGGTAILVGLSGIRSGITAYRKARGQDATGKA